MTALVFLDTETTGLSLYDDIWEIAAIRREPDGSEDVTHLFVRHSEGKRAAMPERFRADLERRYRDDIAVTPRRAARTLAAMFDDDRSTHVVGAVPNFDTERIALLMRQHGITPCWHYHLIDVEALMVGALAARGVASPLPWRSDDLAEQFGVSIREEDRHTAMGDARWARDIYDAVMRGAR